MGWSESETIADASAGKAWAGGGGAEGISKPYGHVRQTDGRNGTPFGRNEATRAWGFIGAVSSASRRRTGKCRGTRDGTEREGRILQVDEEGASSVVGRDPGGVKKKTECFKVGSRAWKCAYAWAGNYLGRPPKPGAVTSSRETGAGGDV